MSIHIGLTELDSTHYVDADNIGWSGKLNGPDKDAEEMERIAGAKGFEPRKVLLNRDATFEAVKEEIRKGKSLAEGDILLVTFSGHGNVVIDQNGDEGGKQGTDQAWCVYDNQILDDELWQWWSEFPSGVRILVVSDSCYSGSILKAADAKRMLEHLKVEQKERHPVLNVAAGKPLLPGSKQLPSGVSRATLEKNYIRLYEPRWKELKNPDGVKVSASVLQLSSCRSDQTAADGKPNSAYTAALVQVWKGQASPNYGVFQVNIGELLKKAGATQTPPGPLNLGKASPEFVNDTPFNI